MSTNYLLAVQLGWCNGHFLPISIYLVRSNEQHLKFGEQTKHNNFIRHSMSVTDVTINGHEKKVTIIIFIFSSKEYMNTKILTQRYILIICL